MYYFWNSRWEPTNQRTIFSATIPRVVPSSAKLFRVKYPNVEVILLNKEEYFHGSLFEDWYKRGEWRKSQFQISHLSDYLFLSLLKGGGIYLDICVFTLKPYEEEQLRNLIGYNNVLMDDVNGSAMHFERGHRLVNEIIIAKEYEPDRGEWG